MHIHQPKVHTVSSWLDKAADLQLCVKLYEGIHAIIHIDITTGAIDVTDCHPVVAVHVQHLDVGVTLIPLKWFESVTFAILCVLKSPLRCAVACF